MQERIERRDEESNLTTADLARSVEAESERREEQARQQIAPETPASGETRQPARTEVIATRNAAATATAAAPARYEAPLFSPEDAKSFRSRWENLQVSFVDEPRRAVEQADTLVAEAIKRLAEIFADERQELEHQWDRGNDVSTEDLRLALQRYRSFFGRLLSV